MSNVNIGKIISVNESEPRKFQVGDKVHYDIGDGKLRDGEVRSYNEEAGEFSILRKYKNTIFIDIAKAEMMSHIPDPDKVVHITRAGARGAITATPIVQVGTFSPAAVAAPKLKPVEAEEVYLTTPEIIDGAGANSLGESIKIFKLATGDIVVAASDKGIGYKDDNEDCATVIPSNNVVLINDGVGGYEDGGRVSKILAEEVVKTPDNIQTATNNALIRLEDEKISNRGGTCYMYSKIKIDENGNKYLELSQAGDVHTVVYDANGNILFESEDESEIQELINAGYNKEELLYDAPRHFVNNFLKRNQNKIKTYSDPNSKPIYLPKGAVVAIYTDGIGDNLTPDEIWDEIRGESPRDAINRISDVTDERMRKAATIIHGTNKLGGRGKLNNKGRVIREYIDGYKTEPKPDNRGLAIIYIQ